MRVAGIIIKDGKILLMRRVKNGEEYFVFPGGGVEEGETQEDALKREIKEEVNLDVNNYEKVFEIENRGAKEKYYLIFDFSGIPQLGGPEKERTNEQNQYYPEWLNLIKAAELKNLLPREAVAQVKRLPETHPSPEYYKAIPEKRMSSGVLLFNDKDEILVVKPSYKNYWSIPGGIIDKNESPLKAGLREVKEEIGVSLGGLKFLCVEYAQKNGDEDLFFLFSGGKLNPQQINEIRIDPDEISEFRFARMEEAAELTESSKVLAKILLKYPEIIKNNSPIYLENGEKV